MSGRKQEIALLASSEWFDADWYHERYRDVALLGMGPAEHYLRIGAAMHRDPGPRFSTAGYLQANPDLAAQGVNPLLHYLRHGHKQGRKVVRPRAGLRPVQQGWMRETPLQENVEAVRAAFDSDFYRSEYPDVAVSGEDPFLHYMTRGWRTGRDPAPYFSTRYYLDKAPELRRAGINPFVHYVLHGRREKRATQSYREWLARMRYLPTVTAIVPNYNHARFLRQRIDSILAQTYPHLDVVLLDDCSSDDSREVIAEYCERYPERIRAILNERNAGNVFRQWRKGVEAATGELVWICESDDFCEPDFLEKLVPHFRDRSVNIAFGRIQFANKDGEFQEGLDNYREGAEAGIWAQPLVRPAQQWFAGGFGVNNVIANVGGCVWRRQDLPEATWDEARTYTILGDWFLYCQVAGGGQIAYEPAAVAYFRQHGVNTSVSSFQKTPYYEEHQRLMTCLRQRWSVPAETVDRFAQKVAHQYRHFKLEPQYGPFERLVDKAALKRVKRDRFHVLIAFLGFHPGGGEVFPIALANALHRAGWLVSMLAYDLSDANPEMQASLDPAIPVYCAAQVEEMGLDAFVGAAGIDLVHSHMVSLDAFLIEQHRLHSDIPYLVSLHGSYEACAIGGERLAALARRIDHWVYTADKNLLPFEPLALPPERFSKIANGMPDDLRPFPMTRAQLGIAEDAVVFAFVARGVAGKGWGVAPAAFRRLRDAHPERRMHLLMCGTGAETDREIELHGDDPDISFLGYQACIHGLYRLSDCAIVPTRFSGESFPLCIIQALQTGTPVIATRIGEIEGMLAPEGCAPGGILIDYSRDTRRFIEHLQDAMATMLDPRERRRHAEAAARLGQRYDIGKVAERYGDLYSRLLTGVASAYREVA